MLSKLQSFFTRYGAYLIFLGDERIKPGMLLEVRHWVPSWLPPGLGNLDFTLQDGYAWEFTGEPEANYPCGLFQANYIQVSVSDKTELAANVSLPQFGVTADAGFAHRFAVAIRLTGLMAKGFLKGASLPELHKNLLKLRTTDPEKWKWVNNDFLVAETFHVTEFEATFKSSGNVTAKAAYESGQLKISGSITYKWENESTLKCSGPVSVPLAARGIRV